MASTVGPSPPPPQPPEHHHHHLSIESIPTVDLRLLSQSELTALSLCSSHAFDLRRCDDVVIPKIDRSVFNESAGSKKQTYSRLRLAPRNTTTTTTTTTTKPRPHNLSPLDADNSRIISLFKSLFNSDKNADFTSALVPVNVEYSDSFLSDGKRKRGRKPKSDVISNVVTNTYVTSVALVEEVKENEKEENKVVEEERERELVNKNGEVVDLRELMKKEDPYGEEIRKRTQGKENADELLGFVQDLDGQWGSRRKKRKIVDANEFGDVLPNGWKVLIAIKKKQGRAWLFCRRYISPNGRYFVSCKEVSSYLLSLTSPEDLKQIIPVQCPEASDANHKGVSENATDLVIKNEYSSLCVTPQSHDHDIQLKPLSTSQITDNEKQLTLFTNVSRGEVQAASALKCHKCSTPFDEKDELLNHLLSCHKRKRRKSGAPIEDDIVMKDGKYECQFCNKVFHERSSYFGHVGIHVKNYVKSISGSAGLAMTAKQKISAVSVAEVSETVSGTVGGVEMSVASVALAPNIVANSELNANLSDSKLDASCEADAHLLSGEVDQNKFSVHAELNTEVAQITKLPVDDSSSKHDDIAHAIDNNVREVEEAVDLSAMGPDNDADPKKVYDYNNNNDLCENLGEISAAECLGSEISKSSAALVENDGTLSFSDNKQVDLGNDDSYDANLLQRERVASESDLIVDNEKNLSGNENSEDDGNSEDRSLGNVTAEHSCFIEGLEVGDDDGPIHDSDNRDLDLGIAVASDVQHPRRLDECSVVFHKEEETCGIPVNGIELMESSMVDSDRNSSCTSSGDQPTTVMQDYVDNDVMGMVSEAEVDMCSLEDAEAAVDAGLCNAQERPESCAALMDNGCGYIAKKAETVQMVEPRDLAGFEQTSSLENSAKELSNRKSEEPKSDQVMNSSNLFFTSESNDRHLVGNVMSSNNQAVSDVSNVLGAFGNFIEDKQEQVPKSILSGLSIQEHMREVAMNNVMDVPSTTTTTQLPELHKVDRSRTNKMIFDFGNIPEINARFQSSAQNENVPEGSSPFSLWGQQLCNIGDNQSSLYGGTRAVAQQERSSDNNSLNLFGLQQPSDVGYNLNKVCANEQSYNVQHNETGVYRKNNEVRTEGIYGGAGGIVQQERASDNNLLNLVGLQQPPGAGFNLNKVNMNEQRYGVQHNESGVYSKNNETRRERITHSNTLNLAGLPQQCDAGYNLNKPCINQQSYGMQCNETGAYSTSGESKQERVTYGNSLSLASVPQTCETRYSLNKACIQQTHDTGFSLNNGYIGTMQGLSKLDELGHSRDRDLMIGFGNSGGRPNQGVATDFLWRTAEGNILPGGLMDSSSSQGQSSGSYQAFDFLSDKGGNDLYAANEKFDNMSNFEGLRSTSVEPMEFSFMSTQESNAQLGHQKVLSSFNAQMDQGFGSSVWHQKPALPNMMAGHVVSTLCVWCGNEFHQDSSVHLDEMQAGSIGSLCHTCKARMSGQFL